MEDVYLMRKWVDNSCAGVLRSAVVVWSGLVIQLASGHSRLSALGAAEEAPSYQRKIAQPLKSYLYLPH